MKVNGIRNLFQFSGWCLDRIELDPVEPHVWLARDGRPKLHCPTCGMIMSKNRKVDRTAHELPMGICTLVTLHYRAIQGRCRACGRYSTIHPEHITNQEEATWRIRQFVARLARHMPLNRVGEFLGIHGTTALCFYLWVNTTLSRTYSLLDQKT